MENHIRRNPVIREIIKNESFLSQKAEPATAEDLSTGLDLLETLQAHKHECVGMAANMIGVNKRINAIDSGEGCLVMYNPQIVRCSRPYEAWEGCLSLSSVHKAKRWNSIKVQYENEKF